VLTIFATLELGEHFLIDLIVGVPYAFGVFALVYRRWFLGGGLLALVASAELLLRNGVFLMIRPLVILNPHPQIHDPLLMVILALGAIGCIVVLLRIRRLRKHQERFTPPEVERLSHFEPLPDHLRRSVRGQAALEMALILPFIVMLLAFIVDLGFAQWRHMQCYASAQAAAQGAAVSAMQANLVCGAGVSCGGSVTCPGAGSGNLAVGCSYAALGSSQAFKTATTMTAGTGTVPGVAGANVQYWVSATVHETIPALFGWGLQPSAISTAAVWTNNGNMGVFLVQ
jgi:hypothetical protein